MSTAVHYNQIQTPTVFQAAVSTIAPVILANFYLHSRSTPSNSFWLAPLWNYTFYLVCPSSNQLILAWLPIPILIHILCHLSASNPYLHWIESEICVAVKIRSGYYNKRGSTVTNLQRDAFVSMVCCIQSNANTIQWLYLWDLRMEWRPKCCWPE